jgi:hypothetical protein
MAPPLLARAVFIRSCKDFDMFCERNFFSCGKSTRKYFDRGAVAKMHCKIEFMKQVLPMFLSPI